MNNVATFLSPICRIKVSEKLGRGEQLDKDLFVTNDPFFLNLMLSAKLLKQIGRIEYDFIRSSGLVAYGKFSGKAFPTTDQDAERLVALQLQKLHEFLLKLWLVKDNAVYVENGFCETPTTVSSRRWNSINTLSDGREDAVEFSKNELRQAISYFSQGEKKDQHATELVAPENSPLERALFFVMVARSTQHLSVKIANYCSALESILITESSELTYRLAQRVAWLLGADCQERVALFQRLKSAYNIRSKVVHGDYLSAKKCNTELQPAVKDCDSILRRVLEKISRDEVLCAYVSGGSKNRDAFEERLLSITFGSPK